MEERTTERNLRGEGQKWVEKDRNEGGKTVRWGQTQRGGEKDRYEGIRTEKRR